MNKTSHDIEKQVEGFHWWFSVRRKLLKSILPSLPLPQGSLALDIGCGTGSNLKILGSSRIQCDWNRSINLCSFTHPKKNKFPSYQW